MAKNITKSALFTAANLTVFNPATQSLEEKFVKCNGYVTNDKLLAAAADVVKPLVPVMVKEVKYNVATYEMLLEVFYANAKVTNTVAISPDEAAAFGKRKRGDE